MAAVIIFALPIRDLFGKVPVSEAMGALGSGGRVAARTIKPGPRLRSFRKARKVRNKMAAMSRRVNNARREGVNV